jgi:hypothetical protein
MANTQGVPTYQAWRTAMLAAFATVFPTSGLKAALYYATATIGPTTTAYTATGEVSGAGYTAGGVTVTSSTAPDVSGTTAFWTLAASIVFSTVTLTPAFDCFMIYDTGSSNRNLFVGTIGSQTITAGTVTISMPTNNSTTGLVRITWS